MIYQLNRPDIDTIIDYVHQLNERYILVLKCEGVIMLHSPKTVYLRLWMPVNYSATSNRASLLRCKVLL